MPDTTSTTDPTTLLHAQLRAAHDPVRQLELYIAFLRTPGTTVPAELLEKAGQALLVKTDHRNRLPIAEVHILRAGLCLHPTVMDRDGAGTDLASGMDILRDDDSTRAIGLMVEAAGLYGQLGKHEQAAAARALAARACEDLDDPATVRARKRDALETAQRERLRIVAVEGLLEQARTFEAIHEHDEALHVFRMAGRACGSTDAPASSHPARPAEMPDRAERMRLRAAAYIGEGTCLLAREQFADALAALLPALELSTTLNHITMANTESVALAQAAVARVYAHLNNSKAEEFYQRSLETARSCERKGELAHAVAEAYEHLVDASISLGRAADARDRARRADAIYHDLGDDLGAIRMRIAAGDILLLETRMKDAAAEYAGAYAALEARGATHMLARLLLKIARLHRAIREFNRSILWLLQALSIAEEMSDRRTQRDAQFELCTSYERMNQYAKALRHYKSAVGLERAIAEDEGRRAVEELQGGFDPEQARRTEMLLRATQQELVRKNNRLAIFGVQLMQTGERIAKLKDQARTLQRELNRRGCDPMTELLKEMLAGIEATLRSNPFWEMCLEQIEEVHPGAVRRLQQRHPELTRTELKVCALKLLDRSAKEMAEALCSAEKTINKHVQRIRRKLHLKSSDDLTAALQSLTDNDSFGEQEAT